MKKIKSKTRGQAAIFDGIMFLLLVSFSVAMMFSFLSDYGNSQARTLRSAHLLNYVQSIGKSVYSLDVSQLAETDLTKQPIEWQTRGFHNCEQLASFGSNTVADLLKRDVSDGKFDNQFGESDEANAPSKLALRCALFELMKPVVGSGFDYNAEVLSGDSNPRFTPFYDATSEEPVLITNLPEDNAIYQVALAGRGCGSISQELKGKQLLAISTPFRVFDEDGVTPHNHQLRICMWPSERELTR